MVLLISKIATGPSTLYDKLVVLFLISVVLLPRTYHLLGKVSPIIFFHIQKLYCFEARAMKYFYCRHKVLGMTDSWTDPGGIKWDVTLCNLLAWTIVFLVLSKGIKSLGKVRFWPFKWKYVIYTKNEFFDAQRSKSIDIHVCILSFHCMYYKIRNGLVLWYPPPPFSKRKTQTP